MAIAWALAAACGFGIADLCAREASQKESTLRTLWYLQLIGIPTSALFLLIGNGVPWSQVFSWSGLAGVGVGLILSLGTIFLYRALVAGPLLIVSPIASSFAVVTFVLSLLSGERPTNLQLIGLFLTMLGVILAAITSNQSVQPELSTQKSSWVSIGVIYALGTTLLHGLGFWLLRFIVPVLGSESLVLIMRLTTIPLIFIIAWVSKASLQLTNASASLRWLLPVGILDTAANLFYNLAVGSGLTSVVSVITSLYSVVTVVLGYLIWKERIIRVQQVGVFVTLVGIALVSI